MSIQSASHAVSLELDPLLAAHLQLALETARIGTWTLNRRGEVIHSSEHIGEMFGREPGFAFATDTQWLAEIHPEDRPRLIAIKEAAFQTGQPLRLEYRSLGCDSVVRWLVSTVQFVDDHLVGVSYDRTEVERSRLLLSGEKQALECAAAANGLEDASHILAQTAVALGMEGCALYTIVADGTLTRAAASGTLPTIREADVADALRDDESCIAEVVWLHPIRTAASPLVGCFAVTLPRNRPLHAVDTEALSVLGRTAAIVITTHELRRRTQESNERLKAAIDELESVVKLAPVGIIIVRGEQVTINRYVEELIGTTSDATISSTKLRPYSRVLQNGRELSPPDFPLQRAALHGDSIDGELLQLATEEEAIKDIIVSAVPLYATDGSLRGAVGALQDVTAIRRLEHELLAKRLALREQLQQLDDIYAGAPIGLCVLDRDLRWVRINERLAQMNAFPASEHIGKHVREVLPAMDEPTESLLRSVLDTGKPLIDIEVVGETPFQPGVLRHRRENWFPLRNATGEIVGINIAVVDTTEQRRAEEALRVSEQRFRVALEASMMAFSILQAVRSNTGEIVDFRWVYASSATTRTVARLRPRFTGTLVGHRLLETMPALRTTGLFDAYVQVVTTGVGHDREFHYPNGIDRVYQNVCTKLDDGVAAWSIDITERTRAVQTIERQSEELRVTVENLRAAQRELEIADRQKDEFLAMLAHELRNPLAAIRNAGELLARTIPNEERAHWVRISCCVR